MSRPEDLIPDEIEHPDQTWHLQQNYPLSQDDQRSLLRIRTRLLAQRSALFPAEAQSEETQVESLKALFKEAPEQPPVGQFLQPSEQASGSRRKVANFWRAMALVAALCMVVLGGTWYAVLSGFTPLTHPGTPRATPTRVAFQKLVHFDLLEVKMTGPATGWARVVLTPQGQYTIARTIDGGRSWQVFDFQGQQAGQIGHFFLDDQTAWVIMGSSTDAHTSMTVMHTTDGGERWLTQHMPPEMTMATFLDRQHGWAWATAPIAGDPVTSALYQTVNGGATWTRLGTISASRALTDLTPGDLPFGDALSLSFLTPQRGWAVIYPPQVYLRAFFYLTQDGGRTWQLQQLPQPVTGPIPGLHTSQSGTDRGFGLAAPQFFTPQSGVFSVLSRVKGQKTMKVYLYGTSDGGLDWSPLGTPIEGTNETRPFMLDPTHLLLADQKELAVYVLVNNQWQKQDASRVANVVSISFIDNQLGWAYVAQQPGNVALLTLYTTSDGGKTWHKVAQNITGQSSGSQGR